MSAENTTPNLDSVTLLAAERNAIRMLTDYGLAEYGGRFGMSTAAYHVMTADDREYWLPPYPIRDRLDRYLGSILYQYGINNSRALIAAAHDVVWDRIAEWAEDPVSAEKSSVEEHQ